MISPLVIPVRFTSLDINNVYSFSTHFLMHIVHIISNIVAYFVKFTTLHHTFRTFLVLDIILGLDLVTTVTTA